MTASKIVSNIILGIIGLLAIALIIMAVVPKSYAVGINTTPYQISVYGTNSSNCKTFSYTDDNTKETYNKIKSEFESSFSTTSINALFSKKLFNKPVITYDTNDNFNNLFSTGKIVIEFNYDTLQTLKDNGKDYVNENLKNHSVYTNGVATYGKLWIVISDNTSLDNVNIYVQRLTTNGNPASTLTSTILKIETLGITHTLYQTLSDIQSNLSK